jgi:NADH-quinone oxidoreductase subunit G
MQRNNFPRFKIFSKFIVISWFNAINIFFDFLFLGEFFFIEAVIGSFLDLEGSFCLKNFFNSFGCSSINYQFNSCLFCDYRFYFILTSMLKHLEKIGICFFFGLNLRTEAPLLNSRVRKSFLSSNNFLCFLLGPSLDYLSFPFFSLGNSLKKFLKFSEGRMFFFSNFIFTNNVISLFKVLNYNFYSYTSFSIFFGSSVLQRLDCGFFFDSIGYLCLKLCKNFEVSFSVVSNFLGRISSFELGCLPGINSSNFVSFYSRGDKTSFIYFVGTDSLFNSLSEGFLNNFLVYQGSFFQVDFFFNTINLVFPVSIYAERVSSFLNVNGLLRRTRDAIKASSFVYADWEIFKALFFFRNLFYSFNFSIIDKFFYINLFFSTVIDYSCFFFVNFGIHSFNFYSKTQVKLYSLVLFLNYCNLRFFNTVIYRTCNHYYSSELFSRNSKILSLCFAKAVVNNFQKF